MGITKTEFYKDEENKIAAISKVIGHPARVAILKYLFELKTCACGELVDEIGLAQPTISQHLKELKNFGIIKGSIDGTKMCYCIDEKKWKEIGEIMSDFYNQIPTKNDCC
ncbi:ArsR/SmtB family transcription factor [Zunongwangia sp.]|uniref:ArsR/SmtB family transcription factor n=1 Tax=Zunongwangia sp. TaxID=1965325 RepID=UPI003AA8D502